MSEVATAVDAKTAIELAKKALLELFADEQLSNLGFEEIEAIQGGGWKITLGFSRPWNQPQNPMVAAFNNPRRTYKTIDIQPDGKVGAVKNRD